MRKEELELTRRDVTPAQFAAYVRHQIRKHGFECICAEDIDLEYWKKGGDLEFDYNAKNREDAPAAAERSISKPYEMQSYIRHFDGTTYNLIMEFEFDDEKTGHGYFYFLNTWNEEETAEEVTEEVTEETAEENGTVKKGDMVSTPRFCTVKIEEVFTTTEEARKNGYTEPTHYRGDFEVLGKSLDVYHMEFAAALR